MKIIEQRTYLPSHVVRRAAYDRLVPQGSDSGYLSGCSDSATRLSGCTRS